MEMGRLGTWRSLGTRLGPLSVAVAMGAMSLLALGRPDPGRAWDFLSSANPDRAGAMATVELVVWGLLVALIALQVTDALRRDPPGGRPRKRRRIRPSAALLAGLMIFVGGAIHHQAGAGAMCCADATRAERLLK